MGDTPTREAMIAELAALRRERKQAYQWTLLISFFGVLGIAAALACLILVAKVA